MSPIIMLAQRGYYWMDELEGGGGQGGGGLGFCDSLFYLLIFGIPLGFLIYGLIVPVKRVPTREEKIAIVRAALLADQENKRGSLTDEQKATVDAYARALPDAKIEEIVNELERTSPPPL